MGVPILVVAAVIVLLKYAQAVFIPLVLSGLLFYALDPVVDRLHHFKIPRALGAAVVLVTVLGVGGWIAYSMRYEAIAVIEDLPKAARNLRTALRPVKGADESTINKIQRAATELDKTTMEAMPTAAPQGVVRVQVEEPALGANQFLRWGTGRMVAVASQGTMILLLTYFLLLADDLFKQKLIRNFGTSLSKRRITVQIVDQISTQIARFLLVQVATGVIVAVTTGLALWSLGLRQAALWGVAAGVLNSIPYFGPMVVTAGLGMIAFMQFGTLPMAFAVASVALAITALEGWLLTPTLLGRAAQMNHVAVFVSLILWSWIWGYWGFFLGIPMMMVVKSVCDHVEGLKPYGDFLGD